MANHQDRKNPPEAPTTPPEAPTIPPDPKAGMDREVGDLDDPEAVEDDEALPGRMGGGLAGG